MRRPSRGLAWVLLLPIALNAPILCGFLQSDSMLRYGGLASHVTGGYLPGAPLEDPSMAYTYEPNGKLAMTQLAHGTLPWWNPYEGTGMPLAGEMQSAAFSPFSPLLYLRNGQAIINVLVELLAGLGLFLLLRTLRFSELSAVAAASVFELNGSFAWLGAETFYAVAFLPLLLYRLELLRRRTPRFGRWSWTALLIAVPVLCGFPETVYFDDLFVVAWVAVRCIGMPGAAARMWVANAVAGGLAGVCLVSPLLIAFFDFLRVAFVGAHGGSFGDKVLPHEAILQTLLPYVWGPISTFVNGGSLAQLQQTWPNVGGYLGFAATLVAAFGAAGRTLRPLRVLTLLWLVVFVCAGFGVPPFHAIVAAVPGARYTSYFRYDPPTWELCAAFLIACTLEDLRSGALRLSLRSAAIACGVWVALLAALAASEGPIFSGIFAFAGYAAWLVFTCATVVAATAALLVCSVMRDGRTRARTLAAVVVAEAAVYLFLPTLANLRGGVMDMRGVDFLRARAGVQRVYTMGPMQPNLGSAFGVAQIDYNDAPVPANLYAFVGSSLDQAIYPVLFTGSDVPGPGLPSRLDMVRRNLRNYAAAGVAYVVTTPHAGMPPLTVGDTTADTRPLDVGAHATLHARTNALPNAGVVTSISLLQGNYGNTATGLLEVRLCVRAGCARASRALSASEDNQYFDLPLDRPLFAGHEPVDIEISSTGTKPDAIWSFADAGAPAMTLGDARGAIPGRHASIRFDFTSFTYADSFTPSDNVPLAIAPGSPAAVDFQALPAGKIAGSSLLIGNYGGKAEGTMRLRACADGRCEEAARALAGSVDNAMLDFRFAHPLETRTGSISLRIEMSGGKRWPALWLFPNGPYGRQTVSFGGKPVAGRSLDAAFVYTDGFGLRSAYDDSTLSAYPVPNVRPYFDAPACKVRVRDRLEAIVDCPAPATLVRLETFMPGWQARVNGSPVAVDPEPPLFQSVRLPAGRSDVRFAFVPPYVEAGYALGLAALAALLVDAMRTRVRVRRTASARPSAPRA